MDGHIKLIFSISSASFSPQIYIDARAVVLIHAPAGGATFDVKTLRTLCSVSIHAPAGGRDLAADYIQLSYACFNPRARGGARHTYNKRLILKEQILFFR